MSETVAPEPLTLDRWRREADDPLAALQRLERRIEELEPSLHALVPEPGRFERLGADIARSEGGPLAGVPIGIKDIFHVDGLETRAGARLPPAELAGEEAPSVTDLRQAGAVVLGKTVTTEFAYFAPGPTRNPRHLEHTPGGSSSGSAAAVAAGYCPLALGTQTIGSISRPASYCGVVGFKPTYGRVPLAGIIPLAPSLDHVGLFTRCVDDAAAAAAILCSDWSPRRIDRRPVLGIPVGPYLDRASAEAREHLRRQCALLRRAGYEIQEAETFADFDDVSRRHQQILAAEVAGVHRQWFARFGDLYHHRTRELIERGQQISQTALVAALEEKRRFQDALDRHTVSAGVDLWLSPAATGPAPAGLDSTGDPVMNLPWTQAGLPTLALPTATPVDGLPMGIQLAARRSEDEHLLAWGVGIAADLEPRP